jgi:hypothetical protein
MITALILIPLAGAFFVSVAPKNFARGIALGFNLITAILAFTLWRNFDTTATGLQLVERHNWIPAIGAEYLVGVDGLSLLLVLLTSLVFPFAFLAQRMDRGACALMLVMQSALYGTFTAQNFILWFLFYEMSLIPAFLLIKIWGGENRDRDPAPEPPEVVDAVPREEPEEELPEHADLCQRDSAGDDAARSRFHPKPGAALLGRLRLGRLVRSLLQEIVVACH